MELCAPGTEDDPPIMYSTLNKEANEKERILKQKAVLKNGQYDNVFELNYVNGAEHWFCNACQCPVMGRVFQHEIGKRHTQNLSKSNNLEETRRKDEVAEEQTIALEIAPGEPVPPGFEEEVGRVAQIQERLDAFKVGPLIALEYLLELQDYDVSKEPVYLCILCDKKGDPRTVLTHLASYNHISQYLQKHFPTCYRALAPYMTKQYKRNWQTTLQKIAEAVEKKFGRLKPFPIEKDKFENDRNNYAQQICKGKHFSEMTGWTFEELIVHDELTKTYSEDEKSNEPVSANWGTTPFIQKPFKKRSPSPPVVARPSKKSKGNAQADSKKQQPAYVVAGQKSANQQPAASQNQKRRSSLSSVSSISSSDLSDTETSRNKNTPVKPRMKTPPFQKGRQPYYERRRSPSPRRRSPSRRDERQMPWHNPNYQKQKNEFAEKKLTEKDRDRIRKIEEFRKLGRAIENDMHKTLKQHEKNPEKHPQYNDEWKKFWNKRYKELQAQGVDVSKHDFKPEWIEFWNKRMIELHSDELRSKKDALRKRLGLPEEINPIKFKIGAPPGKMSPNDNKPILPMAAQPDQDNEVIVIDDREEDIKSISHSRSPWERETPPKSRTRKSRSSSLPRKRSISREGSPRGIEKSSKREKSQRSKSRDRVLARRSRSRSRDFRDRRSHSRERRSHSREKGRGRRDMEKKKMDYRESSYERDVRGKERVRTVADLPWEREKAYRQYEDYYKPPPLMRDATRKPMIIPEGPMLPIVPPEDDDDGEVNVVDVLRLLTALEERLGSLGPKIIDLLAQALALEKKEANSSETLLDNDINCVLFETAKEKLKGQLQAGLVDIVQERAFKKTIKKTATLIHMASQRKRQRERLMPKVNPLTVPGVGTVDKAAIAKQIATALIMQGKTDVTQGELEQLINAVVGMAEASKNSDKPMTTATFLQQLTGGTISLVSSEKHKEENESGEKIIIPTSFKKAEVVELEKLTEPLTPSPGKSSASNMENLSDSDLQTLLQNFKDLSTEEQHNLINYLKKLEVHEPERVERLRKFVNLDSNLKAKNEDRGSSNEDKPKSATDRESPFSGRFGGVNPTVEEINEEHSGDEKFERSEEKGKSAGKVHFDSEDEEYTFEDVVKAVSKNVKSKELEDNMKMIKDSIKLDSSKAKSKIDLSDAKALISNLMGSFSKTESNSIDLLGLGGSNRNQPASNILTSTADFAKTLSDINVVNLANIVSNVKKLNPGDGNEKPLNFEPPRQPPNVMMVRNDNQNFEDVRGNRPIKQLGFPMDFEGSIRGPGGPFRGPMYMGSDGPEGLNRDGRGSFGVGRDIGPIRDINSARDYGPIRDVGPRRDVGPMRDIGPGRDMGLGGPGMGIEPRDRGFVQYPRNPTSYGSNYGNSFPQQQQNMQYPNSGPRSGAFDQRRFDNDNSRFGGNLGNQFGNRPGGGGRNRW